MASTPPFPLVITASGSYHLCAAGDLVGAAGTLIQISGSASWTAHVQENLAAAGMTQVTAGVPAALQDLATYVNRATGYAVTNSTVPNCTFGDTDSPVCIEVPARNTSLWLTIAIYSGAGVTVNVLPAVQSTQRPAGASVYDLNLDQVPLGVDDDLEMLLNGVVTTPV